MRFVPGLALILLFCAGCTRTPQQRAQHLIELGKRHLLQKDFRRASLEFRLAIQAVPGDSEAYYQLGLTESAAGDVAQAVVCFRKAVELNPRHAAAQRRLADLLSTASNQTTLEDAERHARVAVTVSPQDVDALNTLALTELRLGKPEEAGVQLDRALKLLPGGLESSALLMRARLAKGDTHGAEEALDDCYRKSPQSAQVALVMGRFYLVTRRYHDAEAQFRRATQLAPQYAPAWMDLGMLLFHDRRAADAEPVFRRLTVLPDKHYRPVYALYLLETGQRDRAIAELERLAKQDPADRTARTRLVKMYLIAGRRAAAERLLTDAIAKNPKDADALLQRSEMLIDEGKYQDAQNELNSVIRDRPESAEVHLVLARLEAAQGAVLAERQELSEALQRNPALTPVRLDLARLLLASKAPKAALEILEQAPDDQKGSLPMIVESNWALLALGRAGDARKGVAEGLRLASTPDLLLQDALLKIDARQYAAARPILDGLLERNPEDLRVLAALVRLCGVQNRGADALRLVREHAARYPRSAPVQNYLGGMLLAAGQPAEARTAFQAAIAADPHFREPRLALARLDVTEGKLDPAARTLSALLAASPHDPQLWLYMGWLENARKNYPQALDFFRKVVDADPSNVVALNNLAYLLATQTEQFDEALKYAQQVKELAPNDKGVDDTIGWIMYRKGLYRAAVQYLEKAAQDQSDPVVAYHLGLAYLKVGDKRGEPTLRAALKKAPDLPEARMAEQVLADER
ncbi:MAG TPA: tetratricopeptide repeat protein [Bryobacteraceae bacterium]|nr:tetratricopeptide repeat protein [Bryobacteraceae bacterium]